MTVTEQAARLRITYIDATGEMGGAEHLLLTLLEGLDRSRIEPRLICCEEGAFPQVAHQAGILTQVVSIPRLVSLSPRLGRVRVVNPVAVVINVIGLLVAAWRTTRALRTFRPDLVQTNSVYAHIYGGLAARVIGVPCIWYFHDLVETERLFGLTVWVWRILSRCLAARVVAVSRAVADSLGLGDRAIVIYAGIAPLSPTPVEDLRARLGLTAEARIVGYVGRIAHCKGLDVLACAARQVVDRMPDAHFVVMGSPLFGQQAVERRLRALVATLGLGAHWHWLGYHPQAPALMRQFNILVLPSRREALGLALVEAGLAGVPVVATRVGGIPEVVEDGVTGCVVPSGQPGPLARAIENLLNDAALAHVLGQAAQCNLQARFGLARYAQEFEGLYRQMADA